jgi:hypothetical protein
MSGAISINLLLLVLKELPNIKINRATEAIEKIKEELKKFIGYHKFYKKE